VRKRLYDEEEEHEGYHDKVYYGVYESAVGYYAAVYYDCQICNIDMARNAQNWSYDISDKGG